MNTTEQNILKLYNIDKLSIRKIALLLNINRVKISKVLKNNNVEIEGKRKIHLLMNNLNNSLISVINLSRNYLWNDLLVNKEKMINSLNVWFKICCMFGYANPQPSTIGQSNIVNSEGSETNSVSPNNNPIHEFPQTSKYGRKTSTFRIKKCKVCNEIFIVFRKAKNSRIQTCSKICEYENKRRFVNTKLEKVFEYLLNSKNINYKKQYFVTDKTNKYFFDFYLPNKNLLVETHGDFWHGNPKFYNNCSLYPKQIERTTRDLLKQDCAKKQGYKLAIVWEEKMKKYHKEVYDIVRSYEKS
jgi:G:T-mismatch repair DNA endonuclease (very short patch repair protein)